MTVFPIRKTIAFAALLALTTPAAARIQTPAEALAQDAVTYAALHAVPQDEALRRLHAQQDSVPATDAIAAEFRDRLAGLTIEHSPYRIVVLLTGPDPVAPRILPVGGMTVPVLFRTGALVTHDRLLAALTAHQGEIRVALRRPPGIGIDPRTGELVVMAAPADLVNEDVPTLSARLAGIAGVPVRIRIVGHPDLDMAAPVGAVTVQGGARVVGISPADGRRYACTTGFAVTDGTQTGIVTAAHCPDQLDYIDPVAGRTSLTFVGQWGWGYQDVQLHTTAAPVVGLFHADAAKALSRPVTAVRSRASTRSGDIVCHRGERTGYSCATIELTDFAPAGDLCGGACTPSWVTVTGPTCKNGDSGAPVFLGTTAFGIVKGGSYRADGSCAFYFYMSTDYLPTGWRVLMTPLSPSLPGEGPGGPVPPAPDPESGSTPTLP